MKKLFILLALVVATVSFGQVETTYKHFESDADSAHTIVIDESLVFGISTDESHVRLITYNVDGELTSDKSWIIDKIVEVEERWEVYTVHNDNTTFDIIFFYQSGKKGLVIFDYLNGRRTEITGNIKY